MTPFELLQSRKFIGILRHIPTECIAEVVQAMYDGGIRIFEITFNPSSKTTVEDTKEMIRKARAALPYDDVSIGAGTVLELAFAQAAYEAGADFIVSPTTDISIIHYTKAQGMLSIPGAYTPSEIHYAYRMGADIVKVFPVAPNEVGYLKNVMSPLSHIPFIPTGGINPDTIEQFMDAGSLAVAAGASIVTRDMALAHDLQAITANAKKHTEKLAKYCK